MADKHDMRNFSSHYNNINYGPASYVSAYPQPQKKFNNKGFNQLQYHQQQQEFLSSQQFENPQYYYSQQQQDLCFDNDSMLSSNMIAQNPQYSESQDDICDLYFNQKAFLSNQEKSQQNEEQSSMMLPSNNQDIYYDIEEGVQNYDDEYVNQQEILVEPYQFQLQNGNENYNNSNMNAYKNYNFSQNVYVPNINNNQSNVQNGNSGLVQQQQQQPVYAQQCINCSISRGSLNSDQLCQFCIQLQHNSQQSKLQEMSEGVNYQPLRQQSLQQPVQSNQYFQNCQNIPSASVPLVPQNSLNYGVQKEQKNDVQQVANVAAAPQFNDQVKAIKSKSQNKLPINNGIIDDAESLVDECEQNSQNQCYYSQDNSNYYSSEQSQSNNNNSSKNASGSYSEVADDQCYSGSQYNYSNQDEVLDEKRSRARRSQKESLKDASSALNSKKAIKKYKPKKKYKQSRQKNVFKNFGNALMNCIQNNFVIRDFIEKKLGNDANIIEAFHSAFLKDSLNHLKNKEDFLQGWRIQEASDDKSFILFKQVFKEVSLKFFNEYAAKYVNESDKLKNKDIHIKAIPIFIRGLQNVNELYKFKLS